MRNTDLKMWKRKKQNITKNCQITATQVKDGQKAMKAVKMSDELNVST